MDLSYIVLSALGMLLALVSWAFRMYVVPLIDAHVSQRDYALATWLATTAVRAVEQRYPDLTGAQKYLRASVALHDLFARYGLSVDQTELTHLIEQAVHDLHLALGTPDPLVALVTPP